MSPVEIMGLFKLDPELKMSLEEAVNFKRLVQLGYKNITREEAKKVLLDIIKRYGKDHPRPWYVQKVYDTIMRSNKELETRNAPRRSFKAGRY